MKVEKMIWYSSADCPITVLRGWCFARKPKCDIGSHDGRSGMDHRYPWEGHQSCRSYHELRTLLLSNRAGWEVQNSQGCRKALEKVGCGD